VVDTTLRDGNHSISHQYTADQVHDIAQGLDEAGVEIIEISTATDSAVLRSITDLKMSIGKNCGPPPRR